MRDNPPNFKQTQLLLQCCKGRYIYSVARCSGTALSSNTKHHSALLSISSNALLTTSSRALRRARGHSAAESHLTQTPLINMCGAQCPPASDLGQHTLPCEDLPSHRPDHPQQRRPARHCQTVELQLWRRLQGQANKSAIKSRLLDAPWL